MVVLPVDGGALGRVGCTGNGTMDGKTGSSISHRCATAAPCIQTYIVAIAPRLAAATHRRADACSVRSGLASFAVGCPNGS